MCPGPSRSTIALVLLLLLLYAAVSANRVHRRKHSLERCQNLHLGRVGIVGLLQHTQGSAP